MAHVVDPASVVVDQENLIQGVAKHFLQKIFGGAETGTQLELQPIMPLDLPVKVRSWELTVYPRSHIRR